LGTSMSEKKSDFETKTACCTLCEVITEDFLELEDFSDNGFILCANCEAMSTSEDLYGAIDIEVINAHSRKSFSNYCPCPGTRKYYQTVEKGQP